MTEQLAPVARWSTAGLLLAMLLALTWPAASFFGDQSGADAQAVCSPAPNVLRMAQRRPITLDPATARSSSSNFYIGLLFSGLVRGTSQGSIEGDLALDWDQSEDRRVYTFNLRPETAFADGSPIDADDVVFSIRRALSPEVASSTAQTYLGDILGAKDYRAALRADLPGVRAVDERTVQIELAQPKSSFLQKLSYPVSYVVDANQVEQTGWWLNPNSSGAFVLVDYPGADEGDPIIVTGNRNHHRGAEANLIRAEFHPVGGQQAFDTYQRGGFDAVPIAGPTLIQVTDPAHPLSSHVIASPPVSLSYLGFRSVTPPFEDPLVRAAFAHAINVERLVLLQNDGSIQVADGIIPPGIPGYEAGSAGVPGYDPERARELLAESSYGSAEDLPEIIFTLVGRSLNVDWLEWTIAHSLKQNLGVDVKFRTLTFAETLDALDGPSDPKFQLFALGWYADYLDPENFVAALFGSESPVNHFEYSSETVDALIAEADDLGFGPDRLALFRAAERQVVGDHPLLPLYFGSDRYLVQPWVEGFDPQVLSDWLSLVSTAQACPA